MRVFVSSVLFSLKDFLVRISNQRLDTDHMSDKYVFNGALDFVSATVILDLDIRLGKYTKKAKECCNNSKRQE